MHISKIVFLSAFLFTVAGQSYAQLTVKGTVRDSLAQPIQNVNVYVTGLDSTSIKAYDYTNEKGQFRLELKLNRPYLLHISALGYEKKIIKIPKFTAPDTLIKTISLQPATYKMKELVVEGKGIREAIIVKQDTVIFNVESFTRGSEDTVEDILELLPGVTVSSDGRVKVNGKTISKVMIGGDDLFGYNYPLLTKNFTADAIETVSVYDHYHENTALDRISKSEQTVLNLGLKEEFKVDFFGTATAHYDLDKNYELDGNGVSITPNFKGYLFANANNIGDNPTGNIYRLLATGGGSPFASTGTLGANAAAEPFISQSAYRISQLSQSQYLNNQTGFYAFGGIYDPLENMEIKAVGYFLPAERRVNTGSLTIYDPVIGVPNLVEQRNTEKNINGWLGKVTAKYAFSEKMNLKYTGKFNSFAEDNRTNRIFRNSRLEMDLQTLDHNWNQNLIFTRKIAEKKAYQVRVRHKNLSSRQTFRTPPLSGGPFGADSTALAVVQQTQNDVAYLGADFKYWSRQPGSLFSVRAGGERYGNDLQNRITGLPAFTSSRYWNRYRIFSTLTYEQTFSNHFNAYAKLTGNYVLNYTSLQAEVDDHLFYMSPEVGIEVKFGEKQEIDVSYAFNQDLPDFQTLYGGRRLTSYRSIYRGTNNFTLLPSNSFNIFYQFGNWEDNFVANASFNYINSGKSYTPALTITPTYSFGSYRITRDREFLRAGIELNQFANFLSSNLAFDYNYNQFSYKSFFNNTANNIRSATHSFGLSYRTAFIGPFNMGGGTEYSMTRTRNRTSNNLNEQHFISGFVTLNYKISEKINAEVEYEYYNIENAGDYNFLNAALEYDIIDDKLTLYLSATNILDETTFQTIRLGSYSRYQRRTALNHRYVMIGAKFNIR